MKKSLIFVCLCLLLASCAGRADPPPAASALRIVSMAPATTEILLGLDLGDAIVACDSFSLDLLDRDVLVIDAFDITKPNLEAILTVSPTLIYASEINRIEGEDPFSVLTDAGAQVVYLPAALTIADVADGIRLVGGAAGRAAEADEMAADLLAELETVRTRTAAVTTPRTVYFEIGADPQLYSFGANTFLDELLAVCNAENIFSDIDGWISPSAESIIERNPDVILTNIGYIDGILELIQSRPGFSDLTAVQSGAVHLIDPDASSRPSQHMTTAVWQIAEAVYPELFR